MQVSGVELIELAGRLQWIPAIKEAAEHPTSALAKRTGVSQQLVDAWNRLTAGRARIEPGHGEASTRKG